jgi:hypothetical protein
MFIKKGEIRIYCGAYRLYRIVFRQCSVSVVLSLLLLLLYLPLRKCMATPHLG